MNTGIQRSGATPFAAATTTSPVGSESFGKAQRRKDVSAIAVAHRPYVAQASGAFWQDLADKVQRRVDEDWERLVRLCGEVGSAGRPGRASV